MILIIDNYDSFTYNIVEHYRAKALDLAVVRNDAISLQEIEEKNPSLIILSPGPKDPSAAGICVDVVSHFMGKIPIFGVCLGCQAMGQVFKADIIRAQKMYHGKTSLITHDGKGVFEGVENPVLQMRYHSLIVDEHTLSADIEISARSESGEIMGLRHKTYKIEGVQFHPESIASQQGNVILDNVLKMQNT